jgi:hypothetical protein
MMPDGDDVKFTAEDLKALKELSSGMVAGRRVYAWIKPVAVFSITAAGFIWVIIQIAGAIKLPGPR